jgi:hypothetical protein
MCLHLQDKCVKRIEVRVTVVILGGIVVSVLAIGPRVVGFKPGRGDGFFKGDEMCSTLYFGGEVKPSSLYRKILWHVKSHGRIDNL